MNPAWTLFGSLKGILGPQAYIGCLISVPAWFAKTLRTPCHCKHCWHSVRRAIICSILRVAIGFTTASAFVRTNSLRQTALSVSSARNTRRTATTMATWDATRERPLKETTNKKGDVLYWMARDQRAADNWALLRAAALAKENGSKACVVFCFRSHNNGAPPGLPAEGPGRDGPRPEREGLRL